MHSCKILFLLAVGLLCINARNLKRQKRIRQFAPSCGCPDSLLDIPCGSKSILEPTYGGFGICNCQNVFLDELPNCGCGYVDSYGVLNSEVSNYGRVPAIKLPKIIANFDAGVPIPAINLPGLYDVFVDLPSICQAMSPCQCQTPLSYPFIDTPCGCRTQMPVVEYLSPVEVPSPLLKVPFAEPYYIQPSKCQCQAAQLPSCGCQNMPIGCRNLVKPPCSCDNGIKVSYGLPCSCQKNCGCQNVIQFGPQLPALEAPCGCQACQLSPVELPVLGYGCQSQPPPVIGCGGKYLRQVTLQPPFL